MRRITRKKVSFNTEKQVLTGLIVSDKLLNIVGNILEPSLFDLEVSKTVVKWVKDYYEKYKKAPSKVIESIYSVKKDELEEEVSDDIATFLSTLSKEFVENPPNEDYLIDISKEYLRKQNHVKSAVEVMKMAEAGLTVQEIEERVKKRDALNKTVRSTVIHDLFDQQFINSLFEEEDDHGALILKEPFDKYLGPIKLGWLVSVLGPMKRGKTRHLIEFAMQSVMNHKRVLFVSLEMKAKEVGKIMYQSIGSIGDEATDGTYEITQLDCLHNQDNACSKPKRTCKVGMTKSGYIPCTKCSGSREYKKAWFTVNEVRPGFTKSKIQEVKDNALLHYGAGLLKITDYPPFSVALKDIVADMDSLIMEEMFYPEVIIIDYADVLLPDRARKNELTETDETWMSLKKLAAQRHCIVFTATQGNRGSTDKEVIVEKDMGGFYRKLAHVDITLTINQTDSEKEVGMERLGIIGHRHKTFNKNQTLLLVNQFELGQLGLDGAIIWEEKKKK